MRFQVPQFIEVEDKLFGPLTFKQFIYLAGAVGISVMLWLLLPTFFAILFAVPFLILGGALAFYKVDNRPFINVMEAAFSYFFKSRLYIWKKEEKEVLRREEQKKGEPIIYVPKLSESKLKDLAWSLDIKESIYSDGKQQK
jgi:hypothetical protein